jgi:hypothetical protein
MTSKRARSSVLRPYTVQIVPQSIPFLDLPLEVRIMIYTEITTKPENYYIIAQPHPCGRLPAILLTHSKITREIYQFCTMTAVVENKMVWERHQSIFAFISTRLLLETAAKLIKFNAKANHREAVLSIMLRCLNVDCSEEKCCEPCRDYAERSYIMRMVAMGLEKRLITLL